tara:strand:- start:350 stop:703 length:354 start_codon:yes stop_codon:yes gene_type:complete
MRCDIKTITITVPGTPIRAIPQLPAEVKQVFTSLSEDYAERWASIQTHIGVGGIHSALWYYDTLNETIELIIHGEVESVRKEVTRWYSRIRSTGQPAKSGMVTAMIDRVTGTGLWGA